MPRLYFTGLPGERVILPDGIQNPHYRILGTENEVVSATTMKIRHLFQNAMSQRHSLPLGFLIVPGAGLILLGILMVILPTLFITLIAGSLMFLGTILLILAFRMRPSGTVERQPRIRVVDDEKW